MPVLSAGILLHRSGPEVFLVHPGGPFWSRKDAAAWSIPKGLTEPGEDLETAACREFAEEVGAVPPGDLLPLGTFRESGGKSVIAFALAGDFDPAAIVSNTIEVEWPPRSGRRMSIPEVDRAEWFPLALAKQKIHLGQRPILDAFARLALTSPAAAAPAPGNPSRKL